MIKSEAGSRNIRHSYIILILLFTLSNILTLLNNGIFWDDWTLFNTDHVSLEQQFYGNGLFIYTYVHDFLNDWTLSPLVYHWIGLLALMTSVLLFFKICHTYYLSASQSLLFSLVYASLPYYDVKNTAICLLYSLHIMFFYLGMHYLIGFIRHKYTSLLYLPLIGLSLFLAFIHAGMLVLYLAILVMVVCAEYWSEIRNVDFRFILKRGIIFFILLPFLYWLFKNIFLSPTGLYANTGYNSFKVGNLILLPLLYVKLLYINLLQLPLVFIFMMRNILNLLVFLTAFTILFFVVRKHLKIGAASYTAVAVIFTLGAILFMAGGFPYLMVGKMPSFYSYETRHQLLLFPGAAFMIGALVMLVQMWSPRAVNYVLPLLLGICITITFRANFSYIKKWVKYEAMERAFEQDMPNYTHSIVIAIEDAELRPDGGIDHFYVLNGIYKKATGREDLFIINSNKLTTMIPKRSMLLQEKEKFNMREIMESDLSNCEAIFIKKGTVELSDSNVIVLAFNYWFNQKSFSEKLAKIIEIEEMNPLQTHGICDLDQYL